MSALLLLFPGLLMGLLVLAQLQCGELLPWMNGPPQFTLMGGLLLTLRLPAVSSGLILTGVASLLLDLWANTPLFHLSLMLLPLWPVWLWVRTRREPTPLWLLLLWSIPLTLVSESIAALWFWARGLAVWGHLWHLLPAQLFSHLLLLAGLYLCLKPVLDLFSRARL
jgi:hypothetical protein